MLAGAALAFGLVVGSFLNVVIHRLPRGESVVWPGSRCPGCGRGIRPHENIPVFSWLFLRGRCAGCNAPISIRYPLVEAATGLVFVAFTWRYGPVPMLPLWLAFGGGLLCAALIDLDHRIIPDSISLGGLVLGLAAVPAVQTFAGSSYGEALLHSATGALLGGGVLWGVGFFHARVSVVLGRRFEHWPGADEPLPTPRDLDYWIWFPGMGFGDIKLLAAIGAFLGPVGVVETIVVSSLLGLLGGGLFVLITRNAAAPFGFGPAIALGALAVALSPIRLIALF